MATPANGDSERVSLLKPTVSKDKQKSSRPAETEEKRLEGFPRIIHRIENSDQKEYPQLHDKMMKLFCAATQKDAQLDSSSKIQVQTFKNNPKEEHEPKYHKEPEWAYSNIEGAPPKPKFIRTLVSPNSEFAAVITEEEEVLVFDLKAEAVSKKKFFRISFEDRAPKKLKTEPKEDSQFIPQEDGIQQVPTTVIRQKPDEEPEEGPKKEVKFDIFIDFSTDSALLAVNRYAMIEVYNCRECFNSKPEEAKIDWSIPESEYDDLGNVRFMYFYRPSFENSLYLSVDREMLILGFDKALARMTIQKDNLTRDKIHIGNSDKVFDKDEQKGSIETEAYINAMKDAGNATIWHNHSNHIFYRRERKNQADMLVGFRMDWDHDVDEKKFLPFCEYKLNKMHKLFPNTFSPNGKHIFAYSEKSSQIQKLLLDTKAFETEDMYQLTGKKKNFRHLAVKGDGKYLLIVDSQYQTEVLLRSGSKYATVYSFDATYEDPALVQQVQKGSNKKVTEQDLSDMDFLEDGSGLVRKIDDVMVLFRFRLATERQSYALHLKEHFFDSNIQTLTDGRYTLEFKCPDGKFQKIIDFDPKTNDGCIVRTFNTDAYADIDSVLDFNCNLYRSEVDRDNIGIPSHGDYKMYPEQLEAYLKCGEDGDIDKSVLVLTIPNSDLILFYFYNEDKLVAYKKDFYREEKPKPVYTIEDEAGIELGDQWRGHSIVFIDQYGQYIIVPHRAYEFDDDEEPVLTNVYNAKTGELHCSIKEEGDYFYCISKTRMLVCNIERPKDEESQGSDAKDSDSKPDKPKEVEKKDVEVSEPKLYGMIYDLEKKEFTTPRMPLDTSTLYLIKTIQINGKDHALFIADEKFVIFDVEQQKIVYQNKVFDDGEKIPVSDQIQTHCVLLSPDGRYLALNSLSDCDTIVYFDITQPPLAPPAPNPNATCGVNNCFRKKKIEEKVVVDSNAPLQVARSTLKLKMRSDRLNRWCFDKDSKYLLIKTTEGVTVYSAADLTIITCVPVDEHVAKYAKIFSIELLNDNHDLEIAFGYKNSVYFQRRAFLPTEDDLILPVINHKLHNYLSDNSNKAVAKSTSIALIMAQQEDFQKRLDKTFVKILCMINNKHLLDKFFDNLSDESDLILSSDDFPTLVYMNTKNEKGKCEKTMNTEAANAYIDLIELKVTEDKRFPPVKRKILDDWLSSEMLDKVYMRKLVKLITFEPINTTLKGELIKPEVLSCSLTEISRLFPDLNKFQKAKDTLVIQSSPDQNIFDCYQTAISFDLENGSEFSLNYFRWLTDASDDDLQFKFKSVIYYKWAKVLPWAIVYSVLFWILNALYVAYMGFAYDQVGLLITILILNCLFIVYEIKCFSFTFKDSVTDLWNYYDLAIHSFSIFSVFYVHYERNNPQAYKYSWLRLFSFVLISLRAFTMMRVFSATRYLIVMLFEVFKEMVSFLSVFFYIIFIYLFVCLIRTNLVPGGQDNTFYQSVQEAFNIAFSNFDAGVDSVIVLVTTVLGQVVLALVLLNYLIAIVNATFAKISESRDLHDMRMLLDIIREFDCFFNIMQRFSEKKSERIFLITEQTAASSTYHDLRSAFAELRAEQKAALTKEAEIQKRALDLALDSMLKTSLAPISAQAADLDQQLEKIQEAIKLYKTKMDADYKRLEEKHGIMVREAEEKRRKEQKELKEKLQKEKEEVEKRIKAMEEEFNKRKEEIKAAEASKQKELEEETRLKQEELQMQVKMELMRKESLENKIDLDLSLIDDNSNLEGSTLTDQSLIDSRVDSDESVNLFDDKSLEQEVEEEEENQDEYDGEGECKIDF